MQFRHFFWDFDGTLFDTYGRVSRAIQKALLDFGVQADVKEIYPLARRENIRRPYYVFAEQKGISLADYNAAYARHAEEEGMESMLPYPGAKEMLESIIRKGGRNYLYTHRDLSGKEAIAAYGMASLFTDYVTKESGFPGKPAPDALLYLMQKHGLEKQECIMIGDRIIDLDAGRNAGMHCALFDPDHLAPADETPYRFDAFPLMQEALTK